MSSPRPLSNRGGGYTAARISTRFPPARDVAAHFVCLETTARSVRKANKGKSAHSGQRAAHTLRKNRSSARGAKTKSWEKWGMKRGSLTSDSTTRHEPQSYSQSHRIDLYQDANIRRPVRSALPPLVRSLDSYSTLYGLLLGDQARTCSKPARFLSHCPRHSRAPQATPRRRRPRLPQ